MTTPSLPGSTGYGVDIYGTVLYGASQEQSLSVEPFIAAQTDYGRISLSWQSPNNSDWYVMRLVRSTDGFPSTPSDGTVLLEARADGVRTSYDDANLTQGVIYYYAMFMSQDAPVWNSGTTYIQSAVIFYNGSYWFSLQASNTNHTPSIGSAWWAPTTYFPTWYPAGTTASLAVKSQGYSTRLYDRTPQPYKIIKSDLFANTTIDNTSLAHFLALFGFQFDSLKTEYDNILYLNDADKVSAANLEWLGQQFGVTTDYISSPRLRRERIKNASTNYRLKGTEQGIHNAIAAITGWDSDITIGPNLMLNSDQSAFAHPTYDTWRADTNYFINQFITYNGFNYKNLVASIGSAQAPTGANSSNTWWQVQTNSADTTTLLNPSTKGFSTWGRYNTTGLTTTIGTLVGTVNPSVPSNNAWNAMTFAMTAGTPYSGTTGLQSVAVLSTPTWSNATNYVKNNYVLYNTFYYKATRKSGPASTIGFVTPGTNDLYWELQASNVGVGRGQYVRDGIPIPKFNRWDTVIPFNVGDMVEYNGIVYVCLVANTGNSPTGRYSSNTNWQYVQTSERAFTASLYSGRLSAGTATLGINILWYDEDGNTLFTATKPTFSSTYIRFDTDYANLDGTNDNEGGSVWGVIPGGATYWEGTFGQARVNPDAFAALVTKPKYSYIWVNDVRTTGMIGITFGVDVQDTTNYENALLFRRTSNTTYWFASRTRLVLNNNGTETVKATWTRLEDWDRITVQNDSGTITVRKYKRDGTGGTTTLATVNDTTFNTGADFGILQRYALGT